jgi:hypothetical protein
MTTTISSRNYKLNIIKLRAAPAQKEKGITKSIS